ncbi:hypothetical protein GPECTOR_37g170 [Gonium pectorale]|uniref:phytol kinase n=1 Tax=Gonium pectorale TaxID=33097 RepID=A0A150GBF5_GONPE|nr:hypothetical protein GPECTOR_37g170 [Gonium pectorale]|eukprot:KXZ47164.1 hypothetical protein GPECTOR_37g170 [Gonium pectorale]
MASGCRRAAAGGREADGDQARQTDQGADVDAEAGLLPADLRSALQVLDEDVDKLFATFSAQGSDSGGPLASASAARLRRLGKALEAACRRPGAAAAIFALPAARSALLRLVAAALRFPVHDWIAGIAAADGSARHLRASVAWQTVEAVAELLLYAVKAAGPASRPAQSFLRAAVRTQALHAASRQLAELGQVLAPTAVASGAAGRAAGAGGQPGDKEAVVDVATSLLHFLYIFLNAVATSPSADPAVVMSPHTQPAVAEIVKALESSQVLEHAARVLVLVLVGPAHNGGGGAGPMLPRASVRAFRCFVNVHTCFAVLSAQYCNSTDAATAALGVQLRRALCGRCVMHAALVLGLSTLALADGGSSYGLDEIVRMPAVRVVASEYHGVATADATGSDLPQLGEDTLIAMTLQLLAGSTATPRPVALPCRRGAFTIAIRGGQLAVERRLAAAQASGGGSGPQPLVAQSEDWKTGLLAKAAFEVAAIQLYPTDPTGRQSAAVDARAELELWRLGVSALQLAHRWALPPVAEDEMVQLRGYIHDFEAAWRRAEQGSGQAAARGPLHLPPSPPRPLAAALSGGLLPCLEYCLRSAGRGPAGGWQAVAVLELAPWLGEQLAPLLAYGDEREAAALVATLGKLLRRALADPRALDEEVDQLFSPVVGVQQQPGSDSDGPLASASAARLRRLGKALDVVCFFTENAAAILARPPGRSLLRLLAPALRLPVRDWIAGRAAADGSARHLRARVAWLTGSVVAELVLITITGPAPRSVQSFLRAAVRTQALHAASRQLAELAEALAPTAVASGVAGVAAGVEAGVDDWLSDHKEAVVDVTTSLLDFTYTFLVALYCPAPPVALKEENVPLSAQLPSAQPFVAEFAEALESSQVLEHAARVLLLALVGPAHNDGGGGGPMLPPDSVIAFRRFINVHNRFTVLSFEYCRSADAATAALGAALRRALCGRCVTHAALVLGLSVLVSADGGSSYGLDEIVRMPAVRAVAGEYHGAATAAATAAAATGSDHHPQPGEDALLVMMMQLLASSSAVPRPPALPCRRGVFSMAIRVGRLDVEFWLAAAQASGGCGWPPQVPPSKTWWSGPLVTTAFEVAALQLYPPDPSQGQLAEMGLEAEVELWRLTASALRWALRWAMDEQLRVYCAALKAAWCRAEQGSRQAAARGPLHLPPSPPRPVAAALSGGLLPCLEYLLRSAGRGPAGGWQAAAVRELAAWLEAQLAALLAYGDEREAAALVTTLGKLLRRALADPRVLEGAWEPRANFWQAVLSIVSALLPGIGGNHDPSSDVTASEGGAPEAAAGPQEPEPEAAGAGGAAEAEVEVPHPASSPASQQLASVLSFAACHWLPPLSRLAQAALTSRPLCTGPPCDGGGSGGGGIATETARHLLLASLEWLPLLAACCGPQESAAGPEGPKGTGGSDEGDGSGGDGGDGGWRTLLLEEAAVGALLGAAQERAQELEAAGLSDALLPPLGELVARCSGQLAALRSVGAAAAAPSAAGPSTGGGSAGPAGSGGRTSSGGGGGGAAGSSSSGPGPSLAVEGALVAGHVDDGGGQEGSGGDGAAARVLEPQPAVGPALRRLASAMPPPAAALRLLRTCANPGCSSLEGDSEAELLLTPCAGCGEAAYCCRDCWTAHWRAGHRAACARRRLDAGGRREEAV